MKWHWDQRYAWFLEDATARHGMVKVSVTQGGEIEWLGFAYGVTHDPIRTISLSNAKKQVEDLLKCNKETPMELTQMEWHWDQRYAWFLEDATARHGMVKVSVTQGGEIEWLGFAYGVTHDPIRTISLSNAKKQVEDLLKCNQLQPTPKL